MVTQLPDYTIKMNAFEAGVLMGMLENSPEPALSRVRQQLIVMKRDIERAEGVVKTLLPSGLLEIKDADGNLIIRPPYSWEVEGN